MVQKNRTSLYLAQNSNKMKVKTTFADRKKRAEELMSRILMIRKPSRFETIGSLSDTQRILQTLVNTHNYEQKTTQFEINALKEDQNQINSA